ncbi:MAG: dTMP kinase [Candidatus Neomarinimicrobiota bacterium]|nr:dTMP kinase [Candidatus Neomarinimicrobiota bacterium]|tara:strand:- start:50 stop:676 length:627 start_codon:yes stop_codon:yes gene_type:complete
MSISKGKFISFEGIDACGKSTQVKLLLKEMNASSNKTILVREPGGSTISEEIRDILLNSKLNEMSDRTEALLMTGSRAQLTYEKIISNLDEGKNVIADRYSDSTLAYQGGGRGLDIEWLIKLNQFATYNLSPDVTFLIDLHPEEAIKRKDVENDRIEKAGIDLQINVRNTYLEIAKRFDDRIVVLDGHNQVNIIHQKIVKELSRRKII